MGTNSNQKCSLLFLAEQIGSKLGRLGSYDFLLPCRPDAFFVSESRNLYQQNLSPSVIKHQFRPIFFVTINYSWSWTGFEFFPSFYSKDVRLPVQLQRAMAAEAEAAREARAKVSMFNLS